MFFGEEIDEEFDVQDADLEFNFLHDFINSKKGKYFNPELAE